MRFFDCFSGIGGFHVAAEDMFGRDLKPVGRCENEKAANACYEAVWESSCGEKSGCSFNLGDLTRFTRSGDGKLRTMASLRRDLPAAAKKIDLFTAGFPCQPHSLMGNRQGAFDSRGELAQDMLSLVEAMDPATVILENVRAIRSVNGGKFFEDLLARLRKNYNVHWLELNAADFQVPQVRRRVFIIAHRSSVKCPTPKPKPLTSGIYPSTWHLLEREVPERYYLSERIKKTILADQHKGYSRKAEINRLVARPLTRTMHKMHRASQDNYYSDDFIQGKFDMASFSVLKAPKGENRIRKITPLEAFRIQAFPERVFSKWLALGLTDTPYYMLVGNSVPPPLAKVVMEIANGPTEKTSENSRYRKTIL